MARNRVKMRRTHEPFRFIVEREVPCRDRQGVYNRLYHSGTQKPRDRSVNGRHLVAEIHRVARKKLVTSITAKSNGYMPADKSRQQICWDQRSIRKRLVKPFAYFTDKVAGPLGAQTIFVMLGAEMFSDKTRVF